KELEELEKRRTYEFDTIKEIFDKSDSSAPQYFISIKWFKEWKNFVDGVNKDPPGPINNLRIGLQRKRVPKAAWDFLYSVYGGKPVLPVDEA
ncbi:ubiquitin carboxyl-terminal hydrolase 33 isoform X1, partial [Paramuricea clavata]